MVLSVNKLHMGRVSMVYIWWCRHTSVHRFTYGAECPEVIMARFTYGAECP